MMLRTDSCRGGPMKAMNDAMTTPRHETRNDQHRRARPQGSRRRATLGRAPGDAVDRERGDESDWDQVDEVARQATRRKEEGDRQEQGPDPLQLRVPCDERSDDADHGQSCCQAEHLQIHATRQTVGGERHEPLAIGDQPTGQGYEPCRATMPPDARRERGDSPPANTTKP